MIRSLHLADLFTLANASCGMASVFASMTYLTLPSMGLFTLAVALVPLALVFDAMDGRVARWRHAHSTLGRELDSLADVISFGVAPAALAFAAGMRGGWDWVALTYFVGCGVSRLARYNVTAEALSAGGDKVKYFEGAPIPSSVVLVMVLAVAAWTDRLGTGLYFGSVELGLVMHPIVLMFALSGSLMISKTLRIPKL
jgi:CDP-diacylglycerol--serine O-phosphatidyltransferase